MDLHVPMLRIEHRRSCDANVGTYWGEFEILLPILAGCFCIFLRHAIAALRLKDKIPAFILDVHLVDIFLLALIQLQETMPIAIRFMSAAVFVLAVTRIDYYPGHRGASFCNLQSLAMVCVVPKSLIAAADNETFLFRRDYAST